MNIIESNNQMMLIKQLTESSQNMTKLETISLSILNALISNKSNESDDELIKRSIDLTKKLIKECNQSI